MMRKSQKRKTTISLLFYIKKEKHVLHIGEMGTVVRDRSLFMTRFYFQSWTTMHLCAQKSSLCDLMLLGIARKSENRNQPAASLKGAGDAPNLNQTIDLMLINALLFRTPFLCQKWVTTLILFRRLATTTKPYFV